MCGKVEAELEENIDGSKAIKKIIEMNKNCKQCKKEFEAKEELDLFCSQDCKEEALAALDNDS
jgi:NAD-dependent DNA ligase